jgi:NADPH-dependent 2,4-dienoyl-CoA reductase/sulfur reductase-like enzyme
MATLVERGVEVVTSAQVWSIEQSELGPVLHVLVGAPDAADRQARSYRPDALVVATGAHDRALPFPGWTLPGVFTAGAAQALAKGEGVRIGARVVVAGAGPFLLPVATAVASTGARVVGVFEAARPRSLARGWLPQPWKLLPMAAKATELGGYAAGFAGHRIPYRLGHAVVAAHGDRRVEAVTVARLTADWSVVPGTERRIEVDAVAVGHGFTPRLEAAIAAGCELTAGRFVRVDDQQRTSAPGVYAAGEVTGIGGVDAALAEGAVAGAAASGREPSAAVRRRRTRAREFAERIEAAHGIRPGWTSWLDDGTTVCRCEDVTTGALRRVAEQTSTTSLRSLKLTTRAGLGLCQGRVCGRTVEALLGTTGPVVDRRPIFAPVRLGQFAEPARSQTTTTEGTTQ